MIYRHVQISFQVDLISLQDTQELHCLHWMNDYFAMQISTKMNPIVIRIQIKAVKFIISMLKIDSSGMHNNIASLKQLIVIISIVFGFF